MAGDPGSELARASPAASPRGNGGQSSTEESERTAGRLTEDWPLRPSTLLAASVCLGAVLGVCLAIGSPLQAVLLVVCGAAFPVGAILLLESDPVRTATGTVLALFAAVGLVATTAAGPRLPLVALSLAAVAGGAIPTGALGDNRLTEAMGTLVYSQVPIGTLAVLAVFVDAFGPLLNAASAALSAGDATGAILGTVGLVALALFGARSAVQGLPIVELTPKEDREAIRNRVNEIDRQLYRGLQAALVVGVVALVALLLLPDSGAIEGTLSPLVVLTGSPLVRAPLLVVAVGGIALAVSAQLVRTAGGSVVQVTKRGIATSVGVGVALCLVLVHGIVFSAVVDVAGVEAVGALRALADSIGTLSTMLVLTMVAVIGLVMAALLLPAAVGMGFVSDRATAPAFGAAGLLGAAVLVAGDVGAAVVLGSIVAGMVVWDLGEFGVGIAEEVREANANRAETIHATGTLGVGALVFVGAVGAHALVTESAFDGTSALAGLVVAFVGVVLLAVVVRG